MCKRKLNSFPNLLLLHVQATNIGVRDIGLLVLTQHSNRRVSLRGQNVYQGIRVSVKSDR